jgi:protein-S-isoprenylcysteine O-methyltransferase Ste14
VEAALSYENLEYFGPAYEEYMGETKMFIPFIF